MAIQAPMEKSRVATLLAFDAVAWHSQGFGGIHMELWVILSTRGEGVIRAELLNHY
ncbi:hypothetical protein FACS189441_3130 [Betaproteobacteria bacterium]|nr:hypothetical protein FACS189441_3130 [Betaproteobacteria bacterium]